METPKVRSEILETGDSKIESTRIVINATLERIFSTLNNPKRHKSVAEQEKGVVS